MTSIGGQKASEWVALLGVIALIVLIFVLAW